MNYFTECDLVSVELEQAQHLLSLVFEELDDVPRKIDENNRWQAVVFCEYRADLVVALARSIYTILESQRRYLDQLVEEELNEQKNAN